MMTRSRHPFIHAFSIFVVLLILLGTASSCKTIVTYPAYSGDYVTPPPPSIWYAPECERTLYANVVVLDQILPMNRLGAVQKSGQMFTLTRDVVPTNAKKTVDGWDGGPYTSPKMGTPSPDLKAGYVRLRSGKHPRPIVLRANIGDCLQITFTNLLSEQSNTGGDHLSTGSAYAGFHVSGLNLVRSISSDASWVGANNPPTGDNPDTIGSFARPNQTRTYTYYASDEGTYLVYSGAGSLDEENQTGLFGAVNVQPRTAEWYRSQVSEIDLQIATFREIQFPRDSTGVKTFKSPSKTFELTLTPQYVLEVGGDTTKVDGQHLYTLTRLIYASQTVTNTTVVLTNPTKNQFGIRFLNTQTTGHPIINYEALYEYERPCGTRQRPVPCFGPRTGAPVLKMLDGYNNIVYSDLTAMITGPNAGRFSNSLNSPLFYENSASPDRRQPFREFTIMYHDYKTSGDFPPQSTQAFDIMNELSYGAGADGFGINYGFGGIGSEIIANRIHVGPEGINRDEVDLKFEEFFLSSWSVGDPGMKVDIYANEPGRANTAFYPDDPSNVYHSYMLDHVKFRILNATSQGTSHVHHQHAHQWLHSPNGDESHYLDSQLIIPGATYTLEMVYNGSGNRNQTVGDSIFHCHFYPHFAMGMWSLWRVHDVFEAGTECQKDPDYFDLSNPTNTYCVPPPSDNGQEAYTYPWPAIGARALPDGEIYRGTWIPALVPLPSIAMATMPAKVRLTTSADDLTINGDKILMAGRRAIVDADTMVAYGDTTITYKNPGYPFFIPGVGGHRAPHPPLDMAWEEEAPGKPYYDYDYNYVKKDTVYLDGGLPRHLVLDGFIYREAHTRWDFTKDFIIEKHDVPVGDVKDAEAITQGNLVAFQLPERGTAVEKAAMKAHAQRTHASFLPNGDPGNFTLNGLPPIHGAPYAEPGVSDVGNSTFNTRRYKAANIELDVVFNKKGWHYPQQRIITLWEDVAPTIQGVRPPQPFFFRANSGETIDYWHTNLMPNYYELDDYQVRTPTDVIGQHIHLVKFDVTSSDGSANGFNYEDATFSPQEIHERIVGANQIGGLYAFDHAKQFADPTRQDTLWLKKCGFETYKINPKARGGSNCIFGVPADSVFLAYDSLNVKTGPGQWATPYDGAMTSIQRWDADPLLNNLGFDRTLRTVFTHDHLSPSTHQQAGLYAGLIIEPQGSKWIDPVTGERLYETTKASLWRSKNSSSLGQYTYTYVRPTPADSTNWAWRPRYDGGPTNWQANIETADSMDSYREFLLEFQDFQLGYTSYSTDSMRFMEKQIYFMVQGDRNTNWADSLNNNNPNGIPVPVSIVAKFTASGITLSDNAKVLVETANSVWKITEPANANGAPDVGQIYRLEAEDSATNLDVFTETLKSWSDYKYAIQAPSANTQVPPRDNQRCSSSTNDEDNALPVCAPYPTLVSTGGNVGTYSLNYRNEPIPQRVNRDANLNPDPPLTTAQKARATDLSFAFSSIRRLDDRLNSQPTLGGQISNPALDCLPFKGAGNEVRGPFCFPQNPLTPGMEPTDPFTPLLRAYANDKVQIRTLVGAHTLSHSFELYGLNWEYEPSWANSGKTSVQGMGISEHYEMVFTLPSTADSTANSLNAADYLYAADSGTDGFGNGIWGILRAYNSAKYLYDLKPLPSNPIGPKVIDYKPPADANIISYDIVATTATQAMANVDLAITYNSRGQTKGNGTNADTASFVSDTHLFTTGKKGLMYVMTDSVRNGTGIAPRMVVSEPLILRAAAGDWIKITLHNCFDVKTPRDTFIDTQTPSAQVYGRPQTQIITPSQGQIELSPSTQVGLHAQLVSYDVPTSANGLNVGYNATQTTAAPSTPAELARCLLPPYSTTFYWYAGELSLDKLGHTLRKPVEFGTVNLLPSDPLLQHKYGLVGALIIEPKGSSWVTDPGTGTLAAATVTKADGTTFRDFVTLFQVDIPSLTTPSSTINRAEGVNYRSEPLSYRYRSGTPTKNAVGGEEGQSRLFSNTLVWSDFSDIFSGDPQTPIFEAAAGTPTRFRMLYPRGEGRKMRSLMINGHNWQEHPYINDGTEIGDNDRSQQLGSQQITSDQAFNMVLESAGGYFKVPGDYLYHMYQFEQNGAWGLFRVQDKIYISVAYLNPKSNELTVRVKKSKSASSLGGVTISIPGASLPDGGAATYHKHEDLWEYGPVVAPSGVDVCKLITARASNGQTSTVKLAPCTQY